MSESEKSWVHKLYFNAYFEDALAKYRAQTGYGESYAILNSLNEYWHQIGIMSEEGYQFNKKKYEVPLTAKLKQEVDAQNKARQHKLTTFSNIMKPQDYSNMGLEELEKLRNHLIEIGDMTKVQFVKWQMKKLQAEKGATT